LGNRMTTLSNLRFSSKDQRIWFVSDLHYGHNKPFIIGPRGYKSVEEAMADTIAKWKQYIGLNDIVFNLGDQIVGAGINTRQYTYDLLSLPCAHQFYCWGNHNAGMKELYVQTMREQGFDPDKYGVYPLTMTTHPFTFLGDRVEISIDGCRAILDHYPITSWNHIGKGAFHLHGHCHRKLSDDKTLKRLDVGWDWKNRPVEWKEIVQELGNRVFVPVDHHGTKEFLENADKE
jgi:calcineurin-like phosphoesterase family protein